MPNSLLRIRFTPFLMAKKPCLSAEGLLPRDPRRPVIHTIPTGYSIHVAQIPYRHLRFNTTMTPFFGEKQLLWQRKADELRPEINRTWIAPAASVRPVLAPSVWQGVRMEPIPEGLKELSVFFRGIHTWTIDFGHHIVGTVELELEASSHNDSPVRIEYKFAETPYEAATDFSTYKGGLSRSWLQDGVLVLDDFQEVVRIPRRYAFRYLTVKLGAPGYMLRIRRIRAEAQSSADDSRYVPLEDGGNYTMKECAIDHCSAWTLHECMQDFFEDGPKRDRRLWLGDLRIQALVNGVTYRNWQLVERCIYLLASVCNERGEIPGSAFILPSGALANCFLPTYSLLLGPTLLEHYDLYQREEICQEMLPVALRQLEIFRKMVDPDGNLNVPKGVWVFIDHDANLVTNAAALGVYAFSLRRTALLAERLGEPHPELVAEAESLCRKLHRRCFDEKLSLYRAGGAYGQLSWATQVWFILAQVPPAEVAEKVWDAIFRTEDILKPRSPYLWHTVLEAGWSLGRREDVRRIINEYWGGMLRREGDTFPELYDPADQMYSCYGDCLMNSDCHAWSCGAGYFLRQLVD